MHNLYLGLAKYAMKTWKERGLLSAADMMQIQATVDAIEVPSDVGQIPGKIASGFADFTADQWKHWILIYSLICLKGRLPHADFSCCSKFVHACILFSSPTLSHANINMAHQLIVQYCSEFHRLYQQCTINMHLACHLKECVLDFGPFHAFWCYAFERMNGHLGSFSTNHLNIEVQLMRRFVEGVILLNYQHKSSESMELIKIQEVLSGPVRRGTLGLLDQDSEQTASFSVIYGTDPISVINLCKIVHERNGTEVIIGSKFETAMSQDDHTAISAVCQVLFLQNFQKLDLVCYTFSEVTFGHQTYGTSVSRLLRSGNVLAYRIISSTSAVVVGTGTIIDYKQVTVHLDSGLQAVCFAKVHWFAEHPDQSTVFPTPVQIWGAPSHVSFIPVHAIITRVVVASYNCSNMLDFDSDCVMVVPLIVH